MPFVRKMLICKEWFLKHKMKVLGKLRERTHVLAFSLLHKLQRSQFSSSRTGIFLEV